MKSWLREEPPEQRVFWVRICDTCQRMDSRCFDSRDQATAATTPCDYCGGTSITAEGPIITPARSTALEQWFDDNGPHAADGLAWGAGERSR